MRALIIRFVVAASVLTGCKAVNQDSLFGTGASCEAMGGVASCDAVSGGCQDETASVDGDLSTFATVSTNFPGATSLSTVTGILGPLFPIGSTVGVLASLPSGATATNIVVSTLVGQERAIVQSATGPALTITPTSDGPATHYISFVATAPFNGIKLTVTPPSGGSADYLVYEFCGTGNP